LRVFSGSEEDSRSGSSVGGGLRQLVLAVFEVLVEVVGFERLGAGVLGFALGFGFGEAGSCEVFAQKWRSELGMLGSMIASGIT